MKSQFLFIDSGNFKKKQQLKLNYNKKEEEKSPSFWSKLFKNDDEHKPLEDKLQEKRDEKITFQASHFKTKVESFQVAEKKVNMRGSKKLGKNRIESLQELFV
jgi:hypothetical protein